MSCAQGERWLPQICAFLSQIMAGDGRSSQSTIHLSISSKDSLPFQPQPPFTATASSTGGRISPAVLFTVIVVALILLVSGVVHVLLRCFIKKPLFSSSASVTTASASPHLHPVGSGSLQRQLRQLFRLHDSGLDQTFIDTLPLFLYREILGSKEPFDCAVCLCEFEADHKLRLLPICGHAFHLTCIDTWLLSNSTCPLCRGAIFSQGLSVANPMFDLDDSRESEEEIGSEKRMLPVRLGKFKNLSNDDNVSNLSDGSDIEVGSNSRKHIGETSISNLDARRCFSMGYYQYVLADSNLQVVLATNEGRRLGLGSKDESFSVSKIWQWSDKKGKLPVWSDAASLEGFFAMD
ncbi:RING-H2 finger protein ATL46-like [Zingiber officinale]|uniref:RING-H2 finger protein ATL46-like n=1 Tax=Zingiber officinale TaxID=94328 RepID=UPI001C4BA5C6|nr:RING-H2 finger protein ATL46-like [Zingiber officinale]